MRSGIARRDVETLANDPRIEGIVQRIPQALYKYLALDGERLEWARRLIVDRMLFFPSPSQFNDPLDCRIPPDFKASALVIESYWKNVVLKRGEKTRDH